MKHFLILFFLLAGIPLFGQFGAKGGVNISNLTTSEMDLKDRRAKVGFQAGLLYNIKFTEVFRGRTELTYIRKAASYTLEDLDVNLEMDYLEIPLLFVMKPLGFPFTVQVGPQFSYLMRNTLSFTNNSLSENDRLTIADNNFFDRTDTGIVLGFTYELENSFLELRYSKGFSDFEKRHEVLGVDIYPASQHFNIQASYGIYF